MKQFSVCLVNSVGRLPLFCGRNQPVNHHSKNGFTLSKLFEKSSCSFRFLYFLTEHDSIIICIFLFFFFFFFFLGGGGGGGVRRGGGCSWTIMVWTVICSCLNLTLVHI